MGLTLGGGTLYFGDVNDPECKLPIEECEVVETDEEITEPVEYYTDKEGSFSSEIKLDRNTWLSLLYGRKITNNWLKMHGGIMTRKTSRSRKTRVVNISFNETIC